METKPPIDSSEPRYDASESETGPDSNVDSSDCKSGRTGVSQPTELPCDNTIRFARTFCSRLLELPEGCELMNRD